MNVTTSPTTRPVDADALMARAEAASENAYAKYSGFSVGAALLAASGRIHVGCNVENVSYALTTCAEAAAIAAAIAAEGAALRPVAIAIHARKRALGHVPCSPCGACRQRLVELDPRMSVIFFDDGMKRREMQAGELLPSAFRF